MTPAILTRASAVYEAARAKASTPADAMRQALTFVRSAGGYTPKFRPRGVPVDVEAVFHAIAKAHGFTLAELRSPRRMSDRAFWARAECIYIARLMSDVSYPDLGKYLGGRNHSTVASAWGRFEGRMKTNEVLRRRIEKTLAHGSDGAAEGGGEVRAVG